MPNLKSLYQKTKDILSEPWKIADLDIRPGDAAFIAFCLSMLSLILGINFIALGVLTGSGPLIFYASYISVETWGWLIVGSVLSFLIGWISKRALPVTIGALVSASIWVGVTLCVIIGSIGVGAGYLYVVIPLFITAIWIKFFQLQLKRIKPNGA